MAAVNSYDDLPSLATDYNSAYWCCNALQNRINLVNIILGEMKPLLSAIQICNINATTAKECITSAIENFENGAYSDGVSDFTGDLNEISGYYNTGLEVLESLQNSLEKLYKELTEDLEFCNEKYDTYNNACNFFVEINSNN